MHLMNGGPRVSDGDAHSAKKSSREYGLQKVLKTSTVDGSLYILQIPQCKGGTVVFSHCSIKNEIKGALEPEQVFSEVKLQP